MCEFCTAHGEGQKWYLQMRNYQEELLHADLDRLQKRVGHVETRLEWNQRFFEQFVMPAVTGVSPTLEFLTGASLADGETGRRPLGPSPPRRPRWPSPS